MRVRRTMHRAETSAGAQDAPKAAVKAFWEGGACGSRYGTEQEATRYRLEPEILDFIDLDSLRDRNVLEIGVGMGADFVRIAASARAVGIDLTFEAVRITTSRLIRDGLSGAALVSDAEHLPFGDGSFDVVYSWGVLHHTPDTRRALDEAQRVLRPGGTFKAMLYHRHSWLALAAWVRHCLARGRPFRGLASAVAHIESPGTKAFTPREVEALLPKLSKVKIRPMRTHWDRRYAPIISRVTGDRFGWFLLIEGKRSS